MTPSLTGNMFWVFLETKLEAPSFVSQKTGIWIYCCKMRCFKLHSTQNMFCFVNNNIELPWAVYKKKIKAFLLFSFLLLKHVRIKYIAWKAYFGLFAVKSCCCQRYCTWKIFSSSLQQIILAFTSFYSKQRFYLCLAKWRCCRILFLRTTFTFWCSILLEKCFGLLATK